MGFFSKLKKSVSKVGRSIDPTSSKGLGGLGKYTRTLVKPAVATAATGLTGGAALVVPGVRRDAMTGYKLGAAAGTALGAASAFKPAVTGPAQAIRPVVTGEGSAAASSGSPFDLAAELSKAFLGGSAPAAPPWGGLPLPDPAQLSTPVQLPPGYSGGGELTGGAAEPWWKSPVVLGGGLLLLVVLLLTSRRS